MTCNEDESNICAAATSTSRLKALKKSAPSKGWSTSAKWKLHSKRRLPNCRGIHLSTQDEIGWPFAAVNCREDGLLFDLCGNKLIVAPVSITKKRRFVRISMWDRLTVMFLILYRQKKSLSLSSSTGSTVSRTWWIRTRICAIPSFLSVFLVIKTPSRIWGWIIILVTGSLRVFFFL